MEVHRIRLRGPKKILWDSIKTGHEKIFKPRKCTGSEQMEKENQGKWVGQLSNQVAMKSGG